ncbi:3D (Asp-Asp-Asp) domain-containing protein [Desulfitispora alkaliphila]|uniref:3D domain-containing protein n=1 Tax=Desulfitispora alkaliphila TaxID=622674 RepID=UPI003D2521F0
MLKLKKTLLGLCISVLILGALFATVSANQNKMVRVIADGVEVDIKTKKQTVSELLEEAQIEVGSDDIVKPGLLHPIEDDQVVEVIRVTIENLSEFEAIPYETEFREDDAILEGTQRVLRNGEEGEKEYIYELVYYNGEKLSKEIAEIKIVKDPVGKVIARGTKPRPKTVASRGGQELRYREEITMKASAYTHTGNRTYTGAIPKVGIVAVDPNVIPLGTRLYIEGYGRAVASDIGSAIKGNRIDLFMDTRDEALKWGMRNVKVYILE